MERAIELGRLKRFSNSSFKIDWFGNVVTLRMPAGEVRCVRTVCRELPSSGQTSFLSNSVVVNVPLAFLGQIRLGDIWRDGRRVGSADVQEETFSLDVNSESMTSIESGSRRADSTYELPFAQCDRHRGHTESQLTRIAINSHQSLLIPCMEVTRFYFGTCGTLLNKLFGGITEVRDVVQMVHTNASGSCEIRPTKGVVGIAAPDIARIALDAAALHAANMLTKSGIRAAANRELYYPRTLLPLRGTTNLTVRGQWIEHNKQRTFLASQIVSCTHPFPFKELTCHVWAKEREEQAQQSMAGQHTQVLATSPSQSNATIAAPSTQQLRRMAFPDLARKRIQTIWHRV